MNMNESPMDDIVVRPVPTAPAPGAVRLSPVIMTHPRRLVMAKTLGAELGVPDIVLDPEPHAAPNPLRTARVAWSAVADGATHHVVLQDDISASPEVLGQISAAVAQFPGAAIACYANWDTRNGELMRLAALAGVDWVRARHEEYVPVLALSLPEQVARAHPDGTARFDAKYDDSAMSYHLGEQGCPVYIPVPAPVEHIGDDSISDMNHHGIRRSAVFASDSELLAPGKGRTVLERIDFIPFLRFGESMVVLDHLVGDGETPLCVQWSEAMPHIGVGWDALFEDGAEVSEAGAAPLWREIGDALGTDYTHAFWVHCFLVGWQVERISRKVPRAARAHGPERRSRVAEIALSTIGIGGLPRLERARVSEELRRTLTEAARRRVAAGRRAATRPTG